jgi:superfamily II DNA or RNA helicase
MPGGDPMLEVELGGWKRARRDQVPPYWAERVQMSLTFDNPEYVGLTTHRKGLMKRMLREGTPLPPAKLHFYRTDDVWLYVPRGFDVVPGEESVGRDLRSDVPATWPEYLDREQGFAPRDIQLEAVAAWESQGRPEQGVFVLPTGSGKTVFAMMLAARAGRRLLILTNRDEAGLKNHVKDAKRFFGLDLGVIQGKKCDWAGKTAVVATFQTLWAQQDVLGQLRNEFGMVMCDEVQHIPAATFCEVVGKLAAKYRFGMTATEKRGDGLEEVTRAVVGRNVFERRQAKEVARVKVRQVRLGVPVPALQEEAYTTEEGKKRFQRLMLDANRCLKALTSNDARNWALAENIARLGAGRWNLVGTHRVRHAKLLANALAARFGADKVGLLATGVKGHEKGLAKINLAEGIDSKPRSVIQRGKDGELPWIVATYQYAAEGLDIPRLDAGHMATPTGNETELKQFAGRLRREFPGKDFALLLDYLDPNAFCGRRSYQRFRHYKKWEREALRERQPDLFSGTSGLAPGR